MEWLSKALKGEKDTSSASQKGAEEGIKSPPYLNVGVNPFQCSLIIGDEDECASCSSPCERHANLPASLIKKINYSDKLSGKQATQPNSVFFLTRCYVETGPTQNGYKQHVVICNGTTEKVWPEKIGRESGTVDYQLFKSVKKAGLPYSVLITLADLEPEEAEDQESTTPSCDVMVFPAAIKYVFKINFFADNFTSSIFNPNPSSLDT